MLFYRAALPLSHRTLTFVSGLIRAHRKRLGSVWRRLSPGQQALRKAKRQGLAYLVIDGTLIPIDRVAADRPFHSGKHRIHGVNPQVIASPDGTILRVSGDLPGSTHDTAAARIKNILAALRDAGLIALGDKGYHGYDPTGRHVITPYKGRNKPESPKDANRAHARLRGPGERANAHLKT